MEGEGMEPDKVTFTSVLSACSNANDLELRQALHALVLARRDGFSDGVLAGAVDFPELQGHKGGRGVECDDHGLRAGGYSRAAVDLYDMMKQRGLDADESTLSSILSACAELKDCQKLHVASKDCSQSPVVLNALIKMYASCGEIREAKAVFKRMKSCLRPRCAHLHVPRHLKSSANCWNAMLVAYEDGVRLYWEMSSAGIKANEGTFAGALAACSMPGAVREGYRIHEQVSSSRYSSDLSLKTALVHMYARCNQVDAAFHVFEQLQPDVMAWNAMIAAYAQNGGTLSSSTARCGRKIFEQAVRQSPELERNTAVECAAFNLYAKCGKLDPTLTMATASTRSGSTASSSSTATNRWSRLSCWRVATPASLTSDRITPTFDHYSGVVTVLSRAVKLEEAEDLLHSMPFNPGSVGWTSLLGACGTHGHLKRARRAADEAMELDRHDSAPYVLLSNENQAQSS
ncbi:hypothetical protein SELMODRAFT_417058 [Selaginella moellendorffii]|uniref:Pentacotripeptide-repeat region of PRORP domain-containing protein n=1 Tax=Selaginella moellendorffii TaxID=88036 RepID=D8S183_SELML|nr:hypothetical protein SELMODRAFT_417058 [Selaginella moellendorffii]